jgi:glycosyltransferase involved in cell wall biosynthesis
MTNIGRSDYRKGLPLVSVCIPAYNAGATLRETLNSILDQDYPNMEILISDNCSTDDTAAIAQEYKDRGVKYFVRTHRLEGMLSQPEACSGERNWNYLLSLAHGEFIALYHADDLYHPTIVRRQIEFLLEHPGVSAVFVMSQNINERGQPTGLCMSFVPPELNSQSCLDFPMLFNMVLRYHNFVRTPTLMTKRKTLSDVGVFNPKRFKSSSDLDLWLRMALRQPIGIINEKLHYYRISANQGIAKISKDRTQTADFFHVVDYYLAKPEVRKIVDLESLRLYEIQGILDELYCVNNLLIQKKKKEGKRRFIALLKKFFLMWYCLREQLYRCRFLRLFAVTLAHFLGNCCNLDNLAAKIYLWLRRYHWKKLCRAPK